MSAHFLSIADAFRTFHLPIHSFGPTNDIITVSRGKPNGKCNPPPTEVSLLCLFRGNCKHHLASPSSGKSSGRTMPPPRLRAITLTHVRYERGDQLGHFLAWVSLVPVFISLGGFVSHFIFRRELQAMFFALGVLISQMISELTKAAVRQSRPETCALLETCDSHGWPSSHSQYMFFFASYFSLLTVKGLGGVWDSERSNRWSLCFLPWCLAVLTMLSRVYLGYHTTGQVFAGAAMGIVLGAAWFRVVNSVLFRYFPVIEESKFGKMFYIKDTSHIPNVLKFEYDNARSARKNMDSKHS